jgi:hypothetical protein
MLVHVEDVGRHNAVDTVAVLAVNGSRPACNSSMFDTPSPSKSSYFGLAVVAVL